MPTKTFCQAMEAETKRAKKSAEKQYGKLLEVAWPRIWGLGFRGGCKKGKILSIFRGYIGDNEKEHGSYYKYMGGYIGDDGKEHGNYYTTLHCKLLDVAWQRGHIIGMLGYL